VLLEQDPGPLPPSSPAVAGESVSIVSYRPEEVVIDADVAAPGFVVLTDQQYPGWQAEVDGISVPILRVNYLFRAVPVTTGRHRIVFRYVPRSLYWGLALTAAGGVLGAAALVVSRRRGARQAGAGS
jgi:uncharacterized membrane protein YfhO